MPDWRQHLSYSPPPLIMRDSISPPLQFCHATQSTDSLILEDVATHPQELEHPDELEKLESHYFALGEVSNVWKCKLKNGTIVAVKAMRGIQSDIPARNKFVRQLGELVSDWKMLDHPNIMPCLGLTMQFGPIPALIFPMCTEGSIMRYIKSPKPVNKLQLLTQVAAGVSYLHSKGKIHADLRGSNILISDDVGNPPQIMDEGLSLIVSRADFTVASLCGPCRWMPPEVLDPSDQYYEYDTFDSDSESDESSSYSSPFTMQSDVYSLGMTILEVLTGEAPYHHRRYDTVVILDIIRGTLPPRPNDALVSEGVWGMLLCCWHPTPSKRPTARTVEIWLHMLWCIEEIEPSVPKAEILHPF